jgi:hypothetical protein
MIYKCKRLRLWCSGSEATQHWELVCTLAWLYSVMSTGDWGSLLASMKQSTIKQQQQQLMMMVHDQWSAKMMSCLPSQGV